MDVKLIVFMAVAVAAGFFIGASNPGLLGTIKGAVGAGS